MRAIALAVLATAVTFFAPAVGGAQPPPPPPDAGVATPPPPPPPPPPDAPGAEEAEPEVDAEVAPAEAEPPDEAAEEPTERLPPPTPPVAPVPEPVVASGAAATSGIPLRFDLHGYFRTRAVWTSNVPVQRLGMEDGAEDAAYLFQRLRLEPSVVYGSDPDSPIAALFMQFDGLDNVVWGDNARLAATPLFAGDPSTTDVEGFDVPSFRLERAWLQFLIPVGQVRVGRMPSQWGLGILTTDGNGLGEWGDPHFGTTYDRLLFATRPITLFNAITQGDTRTTPLILAVAYDKLVEDPLGPLEVPEDRSTRPFAFLTNGDDDVQETVAALVWNDPDFNPSQAKDELTAGFYFVNRWQESTFSDVYIYDLFWKLRFTPVPSLPSLYTSGEIVTIQGDTQALPFAGSCDDTTGVCPKVDASIWGAVARLGVIDRQDIWSGVLEGGYSSGDGQYFDDRFTVRPLHPDYHVGLLLYQVALASRTAIGFEGIVSDARALWSRGGVWNSWYLWPQIRYTLIPGVEVHGTFLLAWADELVDVVYDNASETIPPDTACGLFESRCFLGWEADAALRLKWGENDVLRWDTEVGVMRAGDALRNTDRPDFGLSRRWLWTIQTRMAMVF